MTGIHRWLARGLVVALGGSPPAAAAPTSEGGAADGLAQAQQLHSEALAARARGQHALAGRKFEEAYDILPDSCTASGMVLVVEANRAYRQDYEAQSDGMRLCENERMLAAALGDGSCTANSGQIGEILRELRQQMGRVQVVCPRAMPVLRWPDESLPLAILEPVREPPPPVAAASPLPPLPPRRGPAIGGAVLLGLGAAALASAAVTAWRGDQLEQSVEGLLAQGTPGCTKDGLSGECERLDNQGLALNRLAIASGILAGAFVVSGVALLIVGRRQTARRLGPGAVGALSGLRWRF